MIIKATEVECRGPVSTSGLRQPSIRTYMDNMTITTTSATGARWLQKGIEKLVTWDRTSFNPLEIKVVRLKKRKIIGEGAVQTIQELNSNN